MREAKRKKTVKVEQHYSEDDVARLLNVSRRTVRRWLKRGRETAGVEGLYPTVRLAANMVRIPASTLETFLEQSV